MVNPIEPSGEEPFLDLMRSALDILKERDEEIKALKLEVRQLRERCELWETIARKTESMTEENIHIIKAHLQTNPKRSCC